MYSYPHTSFAYQSNKTDYKWVRGFDPVLIHSIHYIAQPSFRRAVRDIVEFDSGRNVAIAELLNEKSAVKGVRASSGDVSTETN